LNQGRIFIVTSTAIAIFFMRASKLIIVVVALGNNHKRATRRCPFCTGLFTRGLGLIDLYFGFRLGLYPVIAGNRQALKAAGQTSV
jgi:uncharacterized RDD family membrane protein YckC